MNFKKIIETLLYFFLVFFSTSTSLIVCEIIIPITSLGMVLDKVIRFKHIRNQCIEAAIGL